MVLIVLLLWTGCAFSSQESKDLTVVSDDSVSTAVYDKMKRGDKLSVEDVAELGRHHVTRKIILRYLKRTRFIYNLNTRDIES